MRQIEEELDDCLKDNYDIEYYSDFVEIYLMRYGGNFRNWSTRKTLLQKKFKLIN